MSPARACVSRGSTSGMREAIKFIKENKINILVQVGFEGISSAAKSVGTFMTGLIN